ncbi:MAG: GFA family protein [Wenzhouxiangellaceae bacterium]
MIAQDIKGGCYCGVVRYQVTMQPVSSALCHCADCRKICGAPAVAWISVPPQHYRLLAGQPRSFHSSAGVTRTFCAECGTQLTYSNDQRPDEIDITTASLDDADAFPPSRDIFTEEKLSWVKTLETG